MSTSMGRPVADLDDFLEPSPEPTLKAAPIPDHDPVRRRGRTLWWIAAAAVLVAAGGAFYWMHDESAGPPETAHDTSTVEAPSGVAGFAEMYVATYLTDGAARLGHFLPEAPSTAAMTAAAHYVTRAAAMAVSPAGADYWQVLVVADVLELHDGGYTPVGLQYFQVGIFDDGGRLVAVALPARVAAPAPRSAAPRSLLVADKTPTDTQVALVGDFLEALLTGNRDMTPYVHAASGLAAISPPPYEVFSITEIGAFGDDSILVTVNAEESSGTVSTLQYALRTTDEGFGLVVSDLLAGPPPIAAQTEPDQ